MRLLRPLVLASASPQRKKLLKRAGFRFEILPSKVRETNPDTVSSAEAHRLVTHLAVRKARSVARKLRGRRCLVLGADTLVVCKGVIFGKPRNGAHSRRMLSSLSGSWQSVMTGVCVVSVPEMRSVQGWVETRLRFKTMPESEILRLARKNRDKSGGYAIQNMHDRHLSAIRGPLDNVIGLPLGLTRRLLRRLNRA